ncbi:MAG: hypothetical protein JRN62_02540 [Nitrososphaerota archaeon]|nr:hypothetical protein [Nitrososphaerota archaeon]MDG6948880.1 hypothetical protein [Nitrososphaerota archaeon]
MHTGRRYTDQDSHWKDTEHAQYVGTLECRNDETCRNCPKGYFCCRIYNGDDKPGTRDQSMWFQEWVEGFHPHPESYGVQPLFDPLEVWMDDPEHKKQREELLAKGIDPEYCQYYAPGSGCIIEWPKRPIQCRQYNCGLFMPEDYSPMEVKIVTK